MPAGVKRSSRAGEEECGNPLSPALVFFELIGLNRALEKDSS